MDLSQFSDADLQALAGGDLTKVSDAGLQILHKGMSAVGHPRPALTGPNPYDQFDANPYDQFDTRTPPYSPLDNLPPPSAASPLDNLPPPASLAQQNPAGYNSQSPAFQARYGPLANITPDTAHPVTGEFSTFLRNAALGVGKLYTDVGLGAGQMVGDLAARVVPNVYGPISQDLKQVAAEKRAIDAPLMNTWGGKAGQVAAVAPLLAVPGVNTYWGAGALGAATGALQPTAAGESRLLNTGIGTGTNLLGQAGGNLLGSWLKARAAAPLMGWSQTTGNKIAAQAVGSDAARLDQPALADVSTRFKGIFDEARSPDAFTSLGQKTTQAVDKAASDLNASSAQAFRANSDVTDLLAHTENGMANGQQLGTIASNLGREASAQMTSKMGDRQLGLALFKLKDHVDNLVGSTIADPGLSTRYASALPQYRVFSQLTSRPSLLNSATGDVNFSNYGKFLQRADRQGYTFGGNQSPLYNAARAGQATGLGKGAPPLNLAGDLGLNWLAYRALNNPVSSVLGGVASRTLAPVQPFIAPGLQGLGIASTQSLVPYLTQ